MFANIKVFFSNCTLELRVYDRIKRNLIKFEDMKQSLFNMVMDLFLVYLVQTQNCTHCKQVLIAIKLDMKNITDCTWFSFDRFECLHGTQKNHKF